MEAVQVGSLGWRRYKLGRIDQCLERGFGGRMEGP